MIDILEAFGIAKGYTGMVAFAGGGGKTSLMFRLAEALKSQCFKVLVTTTTFIAYPERHTYDHSLLTGGRTLPLFLPKAGSITVIGADVTAEGKMKGITPEYANDLYHSRMFDVLLVEADGAKRKPIKAPDTHEPVIPKETDVMVGVIGFDCYGQPIGPEWVHRPHLLAKVADRAQGDVIDDEVISRLVASPVGLFKNCPAGAQKVWFINKVETEEQRLQAAGIASSVLASSPKIDKVIIGKLRETMPIVAVMRNDGTNVL